MERKPYKLNPTTGTIQPEKIVGRPIEEAKLKLLLEAQSVVIEEFRRMGKTLFLMKYVYNSNAENKAIYFSLQGVKDIGELIDVLLKELRKEQSWGKLKIGFNAIRKIYNTLKPEAVDVAGVSFKLPEWKNQWKDALVACLEDVATRTKDVNETLTLILDEFPVMLWEWIQNGKAAEAMEFLDILRKERQTLEATGSVRFVVCGSIGLQIVLKHLQRAFNYTGEPFNDTETFSIEGMSKEDAIFLCQCLFLSDFKVKENENLADLFEIIYQKTEGLPFYINKIFSIIQLHYNKEVSKENIEKAFQDLLTKHEHTKIFKQLVDRITIYYPKEEGLLMLNILKIAAQKIGKLSDNELSIEISEDKPNLIAEALANLVNDQYLLFSYENEQRFYSFKYQLIKQWWKINRA